MDAYYVLHVLPNCINLPIYFYMYTQGFLCLFYRNDFQYCLMRHTDRIVQQECVGVVAGLVKVANGQTDRLARILVAQRPLRAHWGSSESLRAQRPLRGLSCDEDHCFSFAGTTTGNKEVETLLPQGLLETATDSSSK